MNYILNQEQINNFMNEAGNGESAQDITLVQPTDIASENTGGDVADLGNDINAVMETASAGLAGARLMSRALMAKRGVGMTEDAVNPFYGSIANKLAVRVYMERAASNKSILTGNTMKYGNARAGTFASYGAQQGGISEAEFRQIARQMETNGNQLGKEMYISDMAAKLGGAIGKLAGGAGLALGAGMTAATWKQSSRVQRGGGILSGLLSIAGFVAAPFTAGASLGLNIAAGAVGVGTSI